MVKSATAAEDSSEQLAPSMASTTLVGTLLLVPSPDCSLLKYQSLFRRLVVVMLLQVGMMEDEVVVALMKGPCLTH